MAIDVLAHAKPAAHKVQFTLLAELYQPAPHATGAADTLAQNDPLGHAEHALAPAMLYEPAEHGVNVICRVRMQKKSGEIFVLENNLPSPHTTTANDQRSVLIRYLHYTSDDTVREPTKSAPDLAPILSDPEF